LGYHVDALADAGEALRVAQRTPPDVIVADLGMPGMDGLEFIARIRNMPELATVPAVALSGASMATDVQQALASGFTTHLTKPVEASEVGKRIEQLTAPTLKRKAS